MRARLGDQRAALSQLGRLTLLPNQGAVWAVEPQLGPPAEVGTPSGLNRIRSIGLMMSTKTERRPMLLTLQP